MSNNNNTNKQQKTVINYDTITTRELSLLDDLEKATDALKSKVNRALFLPSFCFSFISSIDKAITWRIRRTKCIDL
jgi:PBP1b-binding outer membrane lipoprotein LpoB